MIFALECSCRVIFNTYYMNIDYSVCVLSVKIIIRIRTAKVLVKTTGYLFRSVIIIQRKTCIFYKRSQSVSVGQKIRKHFINMGLVEAYWQYFVAGIVCYISARFFYNIIGKNVSRRETKYEEYRTPDEGIYYLHLFFFLVYKYIFKMLKNRAK